MPKVNAYTDKLFRENLSLKPVTQATNPYIVNEADRIFIPQNDAIIRFCKTMESYNPKLKDYADRREAELMEEGRRQALEITEQSGGLDNLKAQFLENENLAGVNPYLHRELGKEIGKIKAVEYNAALKQAFYENGWGNLKPEEFSDVAMQFRTKWLSTNQDDMSMLDSRDYDEHFGKYSDMSFRVIQEDYFQTLAKNTIAKRDNIFQNRMGSDIETGLKSLNDEKDEVGNPVIFTPNYNEVTGEWDYSKISEKLSKSGIYSNIIQKIDKYKKDMGMSYQEGIKHTFSLLENMATLDYDNAHIYISLAGVLQADANYNPDGANLDKTSFGVWVRETAMKVDAARKLDYDRAELAFERKKKAEQRKAYEDFSERFKTDTTDLQVKTPAQIIKDMNITDPSARAYVQGFIESHQKTFNMPRLDTHVELRAKMMQNIHQGNYANDAEFFKDLGNLHVDDKEPVYAKYVAVGEGKSSPEYSLIQQFIPDMERKLKIVITNDPQRVENAITEGESRLLDYIEDFQLKHKRLPTRFEMRDIVSETVNFVSVDIQREQEEAAKRKFYTADEMNRSRIQQAREQQTVMFSQEELIEILSSPENLDAFHKSLIERLNIPYLTREDAIIFAYNAFGRGQKAGRDASWKKTQADIKEAEKQEQDRNDLEKFYETRVPNADARLESVRNTPAPFEPDFNERLRNSSGVQDRIKNMEKTK